MNKKIIGMILAAVIAAAPLSGFAADADTSARDFVRSFGIMSGYGDGNFGDYDTLTRSQLVKIVIEIADRDFIPVNNIAPYTDVPYTSWAASYIQRGSELGYFSGFPDGSFHPDEAVTAEQVCKTMLKILGYETDYTAGNWAQEQIRLASEKGLLHHVNYVQGQPLSRIDTAKVIQNTLLSKPRNEQTYYIEKMGYRYLEDVVPMSDKNVPEGYVATSAGNLKKGVLTDDQLLRRGDAIVDKDNAIVLFTEKQSDSKQYVIVDVLPDRLTVKGSDGKEQQLILESGTLVYNGGAQTAYASAFQALKSGDSIRVFYRTDGTVDYLSVQEDTDFHDTETYVIKTVLSDGVIAFGKTADQTLKFDDDTLVYDGTLSSVYRSASAGFSLGDEITVYYDSLGGVKYLKYRKDVLKGPVTNVAGNAISALGASEDANILRDGMQADTTDLDEYDICYYVEQTDTVLAYSRKITGIYEDALPNKDSVRQIVVSGKTYTVGTSAAFAKLSSDKPEYGDRVTLLFGKDGAVADVVTDEQSSAVAGYVLLSGRKETVNTNKETGKSYYVQALLTDGQTAEYITDKDYNDYMGRLVNITFVNGKATLRTLSGKSDLSGAFDWTDKTFGENKLAKDLTIIDVAAYEKDVTGTGKRIYPQRLDGLTLSSSNILYAEKNTKDEIDRLVLNDYTHDIYSFGIVLKADVKSTDYTASGSYELLIDGETRTVMTNGSAFSAHNRQPSYFKYNGQLLRSIVPLSEVSGAITELDANRLRAGDAVYPVSADVQVYRNVSGHISGRDFELIPLSDIPKDAHISAYQDRSEAHGGQIRIIIVD